MEPGCTDELESAHVPATSKPLDTVAKSESETETDTLLTKDDDAPLHSEDIPEPDNDCDEGKEQCRLSLPLAATFLVSALCALTDIIFLGHISKEALAAAGQATAWIGIFVSVGAALASGGNVLAAQATGQNEPKTASLILLRGVIVSLLYTIPAMAAFYYTWWWSTVLDAKPVVVDYAGDFGRIMLYGMPAQMIDFLVVDFIQSVGGDTTPAIVTQVITIMFNALFNYFFIYTVNLGFIGSPIATVCTSWLGTLVLLIYVCVKMPETRERIFCGWSLRQACECRGICTYIATAGPNLLIFMAGNFPLLILCVVASHMEHPETSLASLNIIMQTVMIPMSLFGALAQGCGTRLSLGVGKASEQFCQRCIRVALYSVIIATLPIMVMYVFLSDQIASVLTSDKDIETLVEKCFPACAVALLFDGFKFVMGEILNAVGRSRAVTILEMVYLLSFGGFINLYWLGFHTEGVPGLVYGWMTANGCYLLYAAPIICGIEWEEAFELAKRRNEQVEQDESKDDEDLHMIKTAS